MKLSMKKIVIILGVLGVSFSAVFVRLSTAPSLVLVLYRVLFAAIVLAPFALIKQKEELRQLKSKDWLLCILGGIVLACHFYAYFESLSYTSIASSVVLVDTEVFFVALAMLIIFKEKIPRLGWLGIVITFAGSIVIALADAGSGSDVIKGDIIAIIGAVFLACYTVIGKACRRHMSTTVYTFIVYTSSTVTVFLMLLFQGIPAFGHGTANLLCGLGLCLFCTLLGHSVYSWGLKFVKASFVSTVKLLEPVFASVLGWMIFGELPTLYVAIGGAVVIAGVFVYSLSGD